MVRDAQRCAPHHEGLKPRPEEPALAGVSKDEANDRFRGLSHQRMTVVDADQFGDVRCGLSPASLAPLNTKPRISLQPRLRTSACCSSVSPLSAVVVILRALAMLT